MKELDLTSLLEITGGDQALERELFLEFIRAGQSFIDQLTLVSGGDDHEQWRANAHAFKGIAVTLGAEQLGHLCKQAQDQCHAGAAEKSGLLDAIKTAFLHVEKQLHSRMDTTR